MRWRRSVGFVIALCVSTVLGVLCPLSAGAQQSSSAHYEVNELFIGSGGALQDCSATYCAKESLGETGVGNTRSSNYQAQGGFNTDRAPYIAFSVSGGSTDLGVLTASTTATTTATFSVKAYLASGYVVQIASPAPSNNGTPAHTLTALTSPTASSAGTEQFGMNLVANTSPRTFGAGPVQVPSSTYGFGTVASGYNTANLYKYVNGNTIASSTKSSGETDYTASYIYNISNVTPDGVYTYNGVFVATATY